MLHVTDHQRNANKPTRDVTAHLSEWRSPKRQEMTQVGETWSRGNPRGLLVGVEIGAAPVENSVAVPQQVKNRATTCPGSSTSEYSREKMKTLI